MFEKIMIERAVFEDVRFHEPDYLSITVKLETGDRLNVGCENIEFTQFKKQLKLLDPEVVFTKYNIMIGTPSFNILYVNLSKEG